MGDGEAKEDENAIQGKEETVGLTVKVTDFSCPLITLTLTPPWQFSRLKA